MKSGVNVKKDAENLTEELSKKDLTIAKLKKEIHNLKNEISLKEKEMRGDFKK